MKYKDYTIKYTSTGNAHADHMDDIFCRVYRQPKDASEAEMLNSFIIPGGEIHDYGSAAICASVVSQPGGGTIPTTMSRTHKITENCKSTIKSCNDR